MSGDRALKERTAKLATRQPHDTAMTGCGRLPSHVEPTNSSHDARRDKYVERPVKQRALDDYDSDFCAL